MYYSNTMKNFIPQSKLDLLLLVILKHYMQSRMRAYLDAREFQAEDTHLMCALDL